HRYARCWNSNRQVPLSTATSDRSDCVLAAVPWPDRRLALGGHRSATLTTVGRCCSGVERKSDHWATNLGHPCFRQPTRGDSCAFLCHLQGRGGSRCQGLRLHKSS